MGLFFVSNWTGILNSIFQNTDYYFIVPSVMPFSACTANFS